MRNMYEILPDQYHKWTQQLTEVPEKIFFGDHIGGFEKDLSNRIFDNLNEYAQRHNRILKVSTHQRLSQQIKSKYQNLSISFSPQAQIKINLGHFLQYKQHPILSFKNFVCSFNGSAHVSRKLLTAVLSRFDWFNTETCSKNFVYNVDILDGHLRDFLDPDQHRLYRKFFIGNDNPAFFEKQHSFGHVRFDHKKNIYNLEDKISQSFLHIVSETLATSYYPFVTEKFLYSVVTRGLFLAYAQPGWHDHLERYYGFKKYNKIFTYGFDQIQNPVERLIELISMISKFSVLSPDDWRDLYEMEIDTIEYNYDHYFSGRYRNTLKYND